MPLRKGDFHRPSDPFRNVLDHYYRLNESDSSCESCPIRAMRNDRRVVDLDEALQKARQSTFTHRAAHDTLQEPSDATSTSALSIPAHLYPHNANTGSLNSYVLPIRSYCSHSRLVPPLQQHRSTSDLPVIYSLSRPHLTITLTNFEILHRNDIRQIQQKGA